MGDWECFGGGKIGWEDVGLEASDSVAWEMVAEMRVMAVDEENRRQIPIIFQR